MNVCVAPPPGPQKDDAGGPHHVSEQPLQSCGTRTAVDEEKHTATLRAALDVALGGGQATALAFLLL